MVIMTDVFYWIGVVSTFIYAIVGACIVIPWLIDQIKLDAEQVKTLWDFVRYKKEFKEWRKNKPL
jgi:hypothetical protein